MEFGWHDEKHERDLGEVAIGEANGRIFTVIYTDRGETRWIISARPANRKERALWHA
jgi:uncharacterized DUF497 family protein